MLVISGRHWFLCFVVTLDFHFGTLISSASKGKTFESDGKAEERYSLGDFSVGLLTCFIYTIVAWKE